MGIEMGVREMGIREMSVEMGVEIAKSRRRSSGCQSGFQDREGRGMGSKVVDCEMRTFCLKL